MLFPKRKGIIFVTQPLKHAWLCLLCSLVACTVAVYPLLKEIAGLKQNRTEDFALFIVRARGTRNNV